MRVLLDTTVVIDYLRGRPVVQRVRGLREQGDTPITSAINAEEVVRGLRPEEHDAARQLFAGLEIRPVSEAEAWLAGRWGRDHAADGVTLAQADCLIAAVAALARARLATGNPDHFPMSGVDATTGRCTADLCALGFGIDERGRG